MCFPSENTHSLGGCHQTEPERKVGIGLTRQIMTLSFARLWGLYFNPELCWFAENKQILVAIFLSVFCWKRHTQCIQLWLLNNSPTLGIVVHTFYSRTWETEADRSLSSKTSWSVSRKTRATQRNCDIYIILFIPKNRFSNIAYQLIQENVHKLK